MNVNNFYNVLGKILPRTKIHARETPASVFVSNTRVKLVFKEIAPYLKNKNFLGKKLGRYAAINTERQHDAVCPASCGQRLKELLGRGVPPPRAPPVASFSKTAAIFRGRNLFYCYVISTSTFTHKFNYSRFYKL